MAGNQGLMYPDLALAQEGVLPGQERAVLDGETFAVGIEVDGLRLAFVVVGPEGVLDGQVFQHQVVAALNKEQAAAAHGTHLSSQGRLAGNSRTGTRGVALVVGIGNHRSLAGSTLDGEVVFVTYVQQFLIRPVFQLDGHRRILAQRCGIAQRTLQRAKIGIPFRIHRQRITGRFVLHGKSVVSFFHRQTEHRLVHRHIIAAAKRQRLVVQLDNHVVAGNTDGRIMDGTIPRAVQHIQEGVQHGFLVHLLLGDHGSVGEDRHFGHIGHIGHVNLVHQLVIGIKHLDKAGGAQLRHRIQAEHQRLVHADGGQVAGLVARVHRAAGGFGLHGIAVQGLFVPGHGQHLKTVLGSLLQALHLHRSHSHRTCHRLLAGCRELVAIRIGTGNGVPAKGKRAFGGLRHHHIGGFGQAACRLV